MNLGLEGKTIFVTGGNTGIGKATAKAFGKEGAEVAISYFPDKEKADKVIQDIKKQDGTAMAAFMDLGDHETIRRAVDTVVNTYGSIDVLVNNAVHRYSDKKPFEEMPIAQWKEMIETNLLGTVKVTQLVVPYMRKQKWGRIISLSSDIAYDSMTGSGPYGSLKAALFGFTANLVTEFSPDGILSNVVVPSFTLTNKTRQHFPEGFTEVARQAFPTRRVTRPEDVASLILYLGSAANKHVNGEQINVTGKGSQAMLRALLKEYREK